jgi:hypothetical protein
MMSYFWEIKITVFLDVMLGSLVDISNISEEPAVQTPFTLITEAASSGLSSTHLSEYTGPIPEHLNFHTFEKSDDCIWTSHYGLHAE